MQCELLPETLSNSGADELLDSVRFTDQPLDSSYLSKFVVHSLFGALATVILPSSTQEFNKLATWFIAYRYVV